MLTLLVDLLRVFLSPASTLETFPAVGKDMLETWSWLSASSDVYSPSSKGSVAESVRIVPQEWAPAPFFLMDLSRPDLDSDLEVLSVPKRIL